VSNEGMRPDIHKKKILGFLALAAFGLFLAPFVAVQIQERIFRHRAEQLLADMRLLMLHKANLAEMQRVFKRWNPDSGSCSDLDCWLETNLSYSSFADVDYCQEDFSWRELWLRIFRIYHGRLARVHAHAQVVHGVVWAIVFQIEIENFSHPNDAYDFYCRKSHQGGMLSGLAASVSHFSIQSDWRGLTLHSNYVIEEGYPQSSHPHTPDVYVDFGPRADPEDIARLASFDFSCLSSLVPCRKPADLMPEAAAQFAKEEPQLAQARVNHVCGTDIVSLMARDAGRAGIVEVTDNHTVRLRDWGVVPRSTVRMAQDFEPASDWKTGETHELLILDAATDLPAASLPSEMRPGNRFIMLAKSGFHYRWAETESCGIVPLNPANLELVQRAIAGSLPPTKH
jgi:hypothetical protein